MLACCGFLKKGCAASFSGEPVLFRLLAYDHTAGSIQNVLRL